METLPSQLLLCHQMSLWGVNSRRPFPPLRLIWEGTLVSLAPHSSKMTFRKCEKNLVLISSVNCDLRVIEQQLAFLTLMKIILCGTQGRLRSASESRERGLKTLWEMFLSSSHLRLMYSEAVFIVWLKEVWGRLFGRLWKFEGWQEHLIVLKPFDNKPWALFTIRQKVVDHPDSRGQLCIISSYWVKGNDGGITLVCSRLCHREGATPSSECLCVPWWFMMWSVHIPECLCGLIQSLYCGFHYIVQGL